MRRQFNVFLGVLWVLAMLGFYWVFLPPLNPLSLGFWIFVVVGLGLALAGISIAVFSDIMEHTQVLKTPGSRIRKEVTPTLSSGVKKVMTGLVSAIGIIILAVVILGFLNSRVFRAKDYANVIKVTEKDFVTDFPESNLSTLALLDRSSAEKIGDTYLGTIDKVSQFGISDDYRQITIGKQPYRVSPLGYKSFWKWLSNHEEGIGYYVKVNQTTGKAELAKLDKGMKYSDSEYFFNDTLRYLRMKYPTTIFGNPSFEVDDKGNPYYVATVYAPKFTLFSHDPVGAIVLDAVTGETKEYGLKDIPEWVDRVYSADNVLTRVNDYYTYQDGFWNTVFSQTGVKNTTESYNYITIGSDIYLYTGITSATADSSNLGFILVNMRTREVVNYKLASATETAAQESAEGEVQEKGYQATAPTLVKLNDKAYYLVSLKDDAGLVKSYALVDAEDYQQVTVNNDIATLISQFTDADTQSLLSVSTGDNKVTEVKVISGRIDALASQMISGSTVYYVQSGDVIYKIKASDKTPDELPFIKVGDSFKAEVDDNNYLRNLKFKE